ncbi:MAG: AmmeMemoRadiSam system radical SAM enzyme [Candidatus Aenigmarchaeota archaeon]|nr:AmmeMemoRadiSam system radical SAM enzyme [Candidatus Aenigmarchaeota archaeon]
MKKAMFYEKMEGKKVQCHLCPWNCKIISDNTGYCNVRKNIDGKLYSLVYGKLNSIQIDPIEKKPFFHFHPGSKVLSIATVGCNFRCKFCCNPHISQSENITGKMVSPNEIVKIALKNDCDGIAYTYTEPTIFFEYAYDIAKLAKKEGLYNVFVTNGYISTQPLEKISKYLDAAVIDVKGSLDKEFLKNYCSITKGGKTLESMKKYHENGVHVEVTDLIVPEVGDDLDKVEELVEWIKNNLNENIPIQFIGFFPSYRCRDSPSTSVKTLKKCREIAKKYLKYAYAYTSQDPGNPMNNTYCPECGELLVTRYGCSMVENRIEKSKCPECGEILVGIWE